MLSATTISKQRVEMIQVLMILIVLLDCQGLKASAPFIIQIWVACQAVRLGARGSAIFDTTNSLGIFNNLESANSRARSHRVLLAEGEGSRDEDDRSRVERKDEGRVHIAYSSIQDEHLQRTIIRVVKEQVR